MFFVFFRNSDKTWQAHIHPFVSFADAQIVVRMYDLIQGFSGEIIEVDFDNRPSRVWAYIPNGDNVGTCIELPQN